MNTRREFLRSAASIAGAAALPPMVRKAFAIGPDTRTGSIQDVEHVVILMQENRSFDHYFGMLRGVRGFGDPRPVRLPDGKPVWYQPPARVKTGKFQDRGLAADAPYVLPFYINPRATTEYQAGTDHGWSSGHGAWNRGHWNRWVTQKQDVLTMGYLKRQDLRFHYALADAFTLCDSYFCSIHADTCPNRIYLWTGTIDPRNAYGRKRNGPGLWERHHVNGYTWKTYPERLDKHGISWRLYQGGTGIPGTPADNYTDNSLEFFAAYQVDEGADPNGPLVRNGVTNHTLRDLREDAVRGRLAEVSWIVAPYKYCEHPSASPTDGAFYINTVLEALTADSKVWSRTVLLIDYDENDGLFDHIVPPMPPLASRQNAQGMVSQGLEESLRDEILDLNRYPEEMHPLVPGTDPGGPQPIGFGPRVPMIVASPWSRGGWVCSQVFDHTSVLRFLEARFGVPAPNISAWRRAISGDLTSAFDFSGRSQPAVVHIETPAPIPSLHHPYSVPAVQSMPVPESGTRPARPIPYALRLQGRADGSRFWVDFINDGKAGAGFYVYNDQEPEKAPRRYAVSAGDKLSDFWILTGKNPRYALSCYGPNGYLWQFRGSIAESPSPEVALRYDPTADSVILTFTNSGTQKGELTVTNAYETGPHGLALDPGAHHEMSFRVGASAGWYDLSVTSRNPGFLRRFAGHLETGHASTSDPGIQTW